MRTVQLGKTGLSSSVLGFGCSAMLGRVGRRDSERALGAAWDAGITFFDTARSYGYGESEGLLGEFLQSRRKQAVIATKFGILAAPQALWKRVAKPAVRAVLSLAPGARAMVRRRAAGEFTENQFTVAVLEQSIHESLRKLRTDYVDFLFMHAAPASVLAQDDLLLAMEKLVSAGKVRVAGISADPEVIAAALEQQPRGLRAAQFPCNVFDLSAAQAVAASEERGWAAVANHPFGGAARVQTSRSVLQAIAGSTLTPGDLREKLGTVNDAVLADVVLNVIVQSPGIHVVVPAMMKPVHLAENVKAIAQSRFTPAEIAWLRDAVASGRNAG